jgi:hypothetical protein
MAKSAIVSGMALAVFCIGCGNTETREFVYNNGNPAERYTVKEFDDNYLKHGNYLSWHENGVKNESAVFVRGNLNGKYESWYENGQIKKKGVFANSERHGKWCKWHENGRVELTGECDGGKKCGRWFVYDDAGKEIGRATFRNGNPDRDFYSEPGSSGGLRIIRCQLKDGIPVGKFLYESDSFSRRMQIAGNIENGHPRIEKSNWDKRFRAESLHEWFEWMCRDIRVEADVTFAF